MHEFWCRFRRYYRKESIECWSIEFDYDNEGFEALDRLVIVFPQNKLELVKVLLLSKDADRIKNDEYLSYILGIFEDLTDGEGSFCIRRVYDEELDKYDVNDLIEKLNEYLID